MRLAPLTLLILASHASASNEIAVTAAQRQSLGITIYNDGQALVRDARTLPLQAGLNQIALRDVAATIRPETASLRTLSGSPVNLLEQNYEFDLLTPNALLKKYAGKEVTILRTHPGTGAETTEKATVLATNEGVVLRYADRIETGINGRIAYGNVPATLRDRPTLSVLLESAHSGPHEAELMYLANNVRWKADYIANVNAAGDRMQLNGWVTLTNQSGTSYENARLQLVAGNLNRVREMRTYELAKPAAYAAAPAPMQQEKIGDFQLYTVTRPTTILDSQTKQVALLSADNVPVRREYVLQQDNGFWWYQNARSDMQKGLKPSVYLRFDNKGGDLGIPLPAGVIRAYVKDSRGGAQFVGEDSIAHTAKGETLSLRLGEAFDLTADRVQTDYKRLAPNAAQSSYRIELRNADKKPVTVTVREPLRGDWEITSESQKHKKESAGSAVWQVQLPAEGKAVLEYTATVRW